MLTINNRANYLYLHLVNNLVLDLRCSIIFKKFGTEDITFPLNDIRYT